MYSEEGKVVVQTRTPTLTLNIPKKKNRVMASGSTPVDTSSL